METNEKQQEENFYGSLVFSTLPVLVLSFSKTTVILVFLFTTAKMLFKMKTC
jgi:hypothetical protein